MKTSRMTELARPHECGIELLRVLGLPIEGVRRLTLTITPDAPITVVIEQSVSKVNFAAAKHYLEERHYVLVRPVDAPKE